MVQETEQLLMDIIHMLFLIKASSVFNLLVVDDAKGIFDAILMGCLPVTFDKLTASVMYTWHWPEIFWKLVSIELPHNDVAKQYKDVRLI